MLVGKAWAVVVDSLVGQKLSATRLLSEEPHKADNKDDNLLEE